jgi:hypothetical protein
MRFRSFVSIAISVSLLAGCAASVEIQETAVAQTATAKATDSPSNYFKYRFNGEVLERKGNLDLDWSSESLYPLDSQSVAAKSFAAL